MSNQQMSPEIEIVKFFFFTRLGRLTIILLFFCSFFQYWTGKDAKNKDSVVAVSVLPIDIMACVFFNPDLCQDPKVKKILIKKKMGLPLTKEELLLLLKWLLETGRHGSVEYLLSSLSPDLSEFGNKILKINDKIRHILNTGGRNFDLFVCMNYFDGSMEELFDAIDQIQINAEPVWIHIWNMSSLSNECRYFLAFEIKNGEVEFPEIYTEQQDEFVRLLYEVLFTNPAPIMNMIRCPLTGRNLVAS